MISTIVLFSFHNHKIIKQKINKGDMIRAFVFSERVSDGKEGEREHNEGFCLFRESLNTAQ